MGQTNFHSKRALEVNPRPWARHVLDPMSGWALGLGIASQSGYTVGTGTCKLTTLRGY